MKMQEVSQVHSTGTFMKKCAALTIGFSFAVSTAGAAFDAKGWTWQAAIDTGSQSGFVAFPISDEVFDRSQPELADLRITDSKNNLVPHMLKWSVPTTEARTVPRAVQLLNETYQPRQFSRVTLDFGQPIVKSQVDVSLPGKNFRRKALLEGSTDSQSWETVAENLWLFDVTLPDKSFKSQALHFPPNNFRYLRLTVYNMPDDPERVTIDGVSVNDVQAATTGTAVRQVALKPGQPKQDEKHKLTEWESDLGSRNLPVVAAEFSFSDPYFNRAYELCGRNSTTQTIQQHSEAGTRPVTQETPWESVASGVLYRIMENSGSKDGLRATNIRAPYRFLKLVVRNEDNPPLHLDGVTVSVSEAKVVFSAAPFEKYALRGGNLNAGYPSYDLPSAVQVDAAKLPEVKLGELAAAAETATQAPWSERHGTLLLVLLVLAVVGMLGLVLSSMRKPQEPGPPPAEAA
jgi:hypothetical protein